MQKSGFIIGAMLMGLVLPLAQAEIKMQPGLWEMTTKMEMQGMPGGGGEFKFKQCIDKKNLVPQNKQNPQQNQCKMSDQKVSGNTVSWKMQCQQGMAMQGEITYSGDSMHGVLNMQMNAPGMGNMQMKQVLSGKRIGACK